MFTRKRLRMRYNSLLALFAFALALIVCSCSNRPDYGIRLDAQNIDLDTVYLDSAVRRVDVGFTNIGKKDLVISGIKTDCDCTTGEFSPEPVSSGDKGVLHITVDLTRFFPQDIEKHVAVYSNATKMPVTIDITGTVRYKE